MSAELPKSERARLMSELDEFFPEVKHSEREMHLLDENQQLESRIAALAAELETTKARSQHNHDCSVRDANARAAAEEALATERAAREKAEAERAELKAKLERARAELEPVAGGSRAVDRALEALR